MPVTRKSLSGIWKHQVNMMYWHPAAKVLRAEMIIDCCIDLICLWSLSPQLYTCLNFAWDAGDVICVWPLLCCVHHLIDDHKVSQLKITNAQLQRLMCYMISYFKEWKKLKDVQNIATHCIVQCSYRSNALKQKEHVFPEVMSSIKQWSVVEFIASVNCSRK